MHFGLCALSRRATPVIEPPVPAPITTISTWPSRSSRISWPVARSWIAGFSGLLYWSRMWAFGNSDCRRRATLMWLSGESKAASVGVRMISAPRASSATCFSRLIFSGIVMITR